MCSVETPLAENMVIVERIQLGHIEERVGESLIARAVIYLKFRIVLEGCIDTHCNKELPQHNFVPADGDGMCGELEQQVSQLGCCLLRKRLPDYSGYKRR